MKGTDGTFLIDYLDDVESTRACLQAHDSEAFVLPVPAYAAALLGEGNGPDGDIQGAREALSWGEMHAVDERTAVTAAEIAADIGPQVPILNGMDGLIAAVGCDLDAPVVSSDRHLTHPETRRVIEVVEY